MSQLVLARNVVVLIVVALSSIVGFAVFFSPRSAPALSHTPSPGISANPLIGEWEVVESYCSQKNVPRELLPKLRISFTERWMIESPALAETMNMTFTETSEALANGLNKRAEKVFVIDEIGWTTTYQIDPTKVPQEIDLLKTDDGKEKRIRGIYKVDGAKAILIFGERDRPSDFMAPVDKRGALFKIRRKGP
jgi:uncharacterized protein (TIGR03067 family)